jgi:hypothetical protein
MLAETEIEALWKAFLEHQSVYYVAKRCKVAPATVRKYRRLRAWDERLRSIRQRARALAATKELVVQPANHHARVHASSMKFVEDIEARMKAGTYIPTIQDLDRIMRLKYHLRGLDRRPKRPAITRDTRTGKFTQR